MIDIDVDIENKRYSTDMTRTIHPLCQAASGCAGRSLGSGPSSLDPRPWTFSTLRARLKTGAALLASILAAQAVLGQAAPATPAPETALKTASGGGEGPPGFVGWGPRPQPQRFDLNFAGGGPRTLVAAIEKATGKHLNAIIPDEEVPPRTAQNEDPVFPPVKLTQVTVPELFQAMAQASIRMELVGHRYVQTEHVFATRGEGENAIWNFESDKPIPEPNSCEFFQLAPYLNNYTIEDITTAIEAGWDFLGVNPKPRLKVHAETKLLIAVGPRSDLETIQAVLDHLLKAPDKLDARRQAVLDHMPRGPLQGKIAGASPTGDPEGTPKTNAPSK